MGSSKVLIIVPRLPPAVDGLGDYALRLAGELKGINQSHFEFLVCDPLWNGKNSIEGFPVHKLESRTANALNSILKGYRSVFLNYVGYGYARRGSPVWLMNGLRNWKQTEVGNKLTTMFHELYAFGPVWTSQFWTSPLQRYIAKELMLLSDHAITSKQGYAEKIERMSNGKHKNVLSLPVFSNVGEPVTAVPFSRRENVLVIFGSPGPRQRVYQHSLQDLGRVCKELKIEKIFDIGKNIAECPENIEGIQVIKKGILSVEEIDRILSQAKAGFLNYPTEFLAKSGIFAAYCAHGVLPVGVYYSDQAIDQVKSEIHYWLADSGKTITAEIAERISTEAFTWYQSHRLSVQAGIFSKFF